MHWLSCNENISFSSLILNRPEFLCLRLTCMLCRASCRTIISTTGVELGRRPAFGKTAVTLTQDFEVQNKWLWYLESYYCQFGPSTAEKVEPTIPLYDTFCAAWLSLLWLINAIRPCMLIRLYFWIYPITSVCWRISKYLMCFSKPSIFNRQRSWRRTTNIRHQVCKHGVQQRRRKHWPCLRMPEKEMMYNI